MSMYKLYWAPATGAFAPHAALAEIGAEFELVELNKAADEHRTKAYRELSPFGQIPTLILPDGTVMNETAAMVIHLADCHPDSGILPIPGTPGRAVLLRWLMFSVCNIYESDLRYFYAERYTRDPDGVEGVKRAAEERWDRAFDAVETAIESGPYFLGEAFSIVDAYMAMLVCWHYDPPVLLGRSPKLKAMCRAVRARPTLAPVFDAHGLTQLNEL